MFGISNGNRFISSIKKGISGIREAYRRQRAVAEDKAYRRMKAAKTKFEDDSIKADLELEKLKLQREMYEAIAAVRREKVAMAKAKKEAGVVGLGERVEGLVSSAGRAGKRFYKGLVTSPKHRATKQRKRKVKSYKR